MEGWVKIYRVLLEKAIWKASTAEQKVILITLLLMASHEEKEWIWEGKKYKIKSGQFITSLSSIAEKSGKGISIQNVRTALSKFERFEFLTNQSTKTGRLITIVNWGIYQGAESKSQQSHQQKANKDLTTIKNDKNDKKNVYSKILEHWNSKNIIKHKQCTKAIQKAINKVLKIYMQEEVLKYIDHYATVFHDEDFYYSHPWSLEKFLKQSNGISNFALCGEIWIEYNNFRNKKQSANKSFNPYPKMKEIK